MSVYIIVDIRINDAARYEEYRRQASATVTAFGGRYLVRGGAVQILEGAPTPARVVVLEFPSAEQARAWWESDVYAPLKAIRQRCAATDMILVEGI